jgi:hypothetical protein
MRRCDRAKARAAAGRALSPALLAGVAAALAGCSQAIETPLPELAAITRDLLSADEQKKAVEELERSKESHRAEAIRAIEQERAAAGGGAGGPPPDAPLTTRAE